MQSGRPNLASLATRLKRVSVPPESKVVVWRERDTLAERAARAFKRKKESVLVNGTHWLSDEALPRKLELADVGRDGHDEVERVSVDDAVAHVVQFRLQPCEHSDHTELMSALARPQE